MEVGYGSKENLGETQNLVLEIWLELIMVF